MFSLNIVFTSCKMKQQECLKFNSSLQSKTLRKQVMYLNGFSFISSQCIFFCFL